jgi:hypothetical protein
VAKFYSCSCGFTSRNAYDYLSHECDGTPTSVDAKAVDSRTAPVEEKPFRLNLSAEIDWFADPDCYGWDGLR